MLPYECLSRASRILLKLQPGGTKKGRAARDALEILARCSDHVDLAGTWTRTRPSSRWWETRA